MSAGARARIRQQQTPSAITERSRLFVVEANAVPRHARRMFSSMLARALLLGLTMSASFQLTAKAEDALGKQVVGTWREARFETRSKEIREGDNMVTFAADQTLKLHLKKGEKGDLRSIDGTWQLGADGALKMELMVDGKKAPQTMKVSFEGGEMIFTDEDGRRTWHTRHEGPLPEQYRW